MGSRPHIYGRGTYKNTTLGFLRPSERIAPERCPHGSCPPSYIPSGPLPVREAPLTGPTREGSAKNCPPPPRRGEGDNSDASAPSLFASKSFPPLIYAGEKKNSIVDVFVYSRRSPIYIRGSFARTSFSIKK
jgi:hypothetical protein